MAVDECYTTVDCALKYTLVHLKTKQRDTALHKFMTYCTQRYGIVEQEIFGYSSVSAGSASDGLFEHPAFRVLVLHKAESRLCFSWWIESPGIRGGGILAAYARRSGAPGGGRELVVHRCVTKWTPPAPSSPEYDVVKKRRTMESSPPSTHDDDDSASALAAFADFERSVLPALQSIAEDEAEHRRAELEALEDCMARGVVAPTAGGVYFAWSDCLGCMKIGATRRDDPLLRLRELSRHVTTPFVLCGWLPTATPFRLETRAHAHFAAARIGRAPGTGTEFFRIDAAAVAEYCGSGVGRA